ncbi:DUF2913 family protein [Lelliottia wanjuensis]|uniref:DUF2913 family protein n=1 Tax=Lelliottia wanjuensis TaxID=3050585 RepID=UPI00254AD77E|nr:DUF2913 family protein [Lelliottia sp. V86_10]MDK9587255.1 DUF2913 family protein [Lelliottia sp. V86_10]
MIWKTRDIIPFETSPLMNRIHPPLSPEQTVSDLAHFAWCALVALKLAQQDGQAMSPMMAHTFLVRWLAVAQKQRRFPRSIALDIDSLLKLGRQKGPTTGLQQRLEYLLESCSSPVSYQSDLFRLTYAIEALKAQGWVNAAVADHEWDIPALLAEYGDISALLVRKSDLVRHFNDEGQLTGRVEFLLKGQPQVVLDAFNARSLLCTVPESPYGWSVVILKPDQR